MKHRGGTQLLFVVLMVGLLAGSASAATIEEEIVVSQKNLSIIEFIVEEPGGIYAELELKGAIEEIELILESPSGELKGDVWGDMPRYLGYKVSKEDLTEGKWQISVKSGSYERAYGTLKITYPSDTTPPTVIDNTPTGGNVTVTTRITITFSEPMNKESAEDAFSLYPESIYSEVPGEFDWDENMMIFKPSSNLDYDTRYVVGVGMQQQQAMDLAGNRLSCMNGNSRLDHRTIHPTHRTVHQDQIMDTLEHHTVIQPLPKIQMKIK